MTEREQADAEASPFVESPAPVIPENARAQRREEAPTPRPPARPRSTAKGAAKKGKAAKSAKRKRAATKATKKRAATKAAKTTPKRRHVPSVPFVDTTAKEEGATHAG